MCERNERWTQKHAYLCEPTTAICGNAISIVLSSLPSRSSASMFCTDVNKSCSVLIIGMSREKSAGVVADDEGVAVACGTSAYRNWLLFPGDEDGAVISPGVYVWLGGGGEYCICNEEDAGRGDATRYGDEFEFDGGITPPFFFSLSLSDSRLERHHNDLYFTQTQFLPLPLSLSHVSLTKKKKREMNKRVYFRVPRSNTDAPTASFAKP